MVGISDKPVLEHRLPPMTMFPLNVTVTTIPHSSNTILHPTLHRVTTDISEYDDIPGMMWPDCAACGGSGRSSSCLLVEVSLEPSEIVTMIGLVTIGIPVVDASVTRKWLVALGSNIAKFLMSLKSKLIVLKYCWMHVHNYISWG